MSMTDCCHCTTCKCGLRRISSIDSNATADNLPGPGRTLGLFFAYLGRNLERGMGALAARRGYGPDAVADAIACLRVHHQRTICDMYIAEVEQSGAVFEGSRRRKLEKKCKKLVRYSLRGSSDSTVITANNRITKLSVFDPFVQKLLRGFLYSYDPDLFSQFGERNASLGSSRLDPLLASSRKALISVTEVEIQKMWLDFYLVSEIGSREQVCIGCSEWLAYEGSFDSTLERWIIKCATRVLRFFSC